MPLSETTKYTIAALSFYGLIYGILGTVIGAVGVHDLVMGESMFGPKISPEGSVLTAQLGLSIGVPLMIISGGVLYAMTRKGT
jgi:hypothetical protein